jgi:streptogramin lyase
MMVLKECTSHKTGFSQDAKQGISVRHSFFISLCLLLLLASSCSNRGGTQGNIEPVEPLPTFAQVANTTHTVLAQGTFEEYALPQSHSSMMRPVIDHQGRVWFGEMGRNYLAFFDPRTHLFQQMTPPRGANGIMGIAVAADDTIWFAEQYANYIGHYFPATGQYRTYDLPILHKPNPSAPTKILSLPTAPNDLVLDQQGNVWFTEMNADAIGELHIKTGQFTHYPISSPRTIQVLNPYGITVDLQGDIWFTETSSNHLWRLDPKTGASRYYTSSNGSEPLMEVASDSHGNIWATSFGSGLLLKFEPASGRFLSYIAPNNGTNAGGLYGLAIATDDEVWVTITSGNSIARFDSRAEQFLYYQIPTGASMPFGLAVTTEHMVWFTEPGANQLGSLKP